MKKYLSEIRILDFIPDSGDVFPSLLVGFVVSLLYPQLFIPFCIGWAVSRAIRRHIDVIKVVENCIAKKTKSKKTKPGKTDLLEQDYKEKRRKLSPPILMSICFLTVMLILGLLALCW